MRGKFGDTEWDNPDLRTEVSIGEGAWGADGGGEVRSWIEPGVENGRRTPDFPVRGTKLERAIGGHEDQADFCRGGTEWTERGAGGVNWG